MKKFLSFAVFAFTMLLAGCSEVEFSSPGEDLVEVSFTAASATKTTLGTDNSVAWCVGDQVSVSVAGGNKYKFTVDSVNDGVAVFKALVAASDAEADIECAVYPYQEDFQIWWTHPRNIPIASEQPFVDGGFANGINTSIGWLAAPAGGRMTFYNMCGLMAVTVTSDIPLTSAKLMGNGGETLSGVFDFEAYNHAYEAERSAVPSVSIVSDNAIDCTTAKTFVFVVKPGEFTSGVSLYFYDANDHVASCVISKGFKLPRSSKVVLPAVTLSSSDFKEAFDPSKLNIASNDWKVSNWSSSNADRYQVNRYVVNNFIADASDVPEGKGRKYYINYNKTWSDGKLYFDISDVPMPGHEGCFKLTNFQDRSGYDQLPDAENFSYYDPVNNVVVFDLVIHGSYNHAYSYIYYKDVPGFADTYNLVGNYTATPAEAVFEKTYYKWMETNSAEPTPKDWQLNGNYRQMTNVIAAAAGAPAGQKYQICYSTKWADGILFFDVLPIPVAGKSCCWWLGNMKDRATGGDSVSQNASYFDSSNGTVVFDFTIDNNNTVFEMSYVHTL